MKKQYILLSAMALSAAFTSTANAHAGHGSVEHQCREFTRTIIIGGEPQQGVGTACLHSDGSWQIVSDAKVPATIKEPQVVKGEAPVKVIEKETIVYRDRPSYRYGYKRPYGKHFGYGAYYGGKRFHNRFGKRYSKRFGSRYHSRHKGFGYYNRY